MIILASVQVKPHFFLSVVLVKCVFIVVDYDLIQQVKRWTSFVNLIEVAFIYFLILLILITLL